MWEGDKKGVLDANLKSRLQCVYEDEILQPSPKADLHPKKVMLCYLRIFRGVIHVELFLTYKIITSKVYCHQLDRLNQTLIEKEPTLVNLKVVIF